MMKFDKSRIYTSVNADELKIGSKVIVADYLATLKSLLKNPDQVPVKTISDILPDDNMYRFVTENTEWALAYLVSEPEGLKWTDLKIGDVIREKDGSKQSMITMIDSSNEDNDEMHIYAGQYWIANEKLADWEKED